MTPGLCCASLQSWLGRSWGYEFVSRSLPMTTRREILRAQITPSTLAAPASAYHSPRPSPRAVPKPHATALRSRHWRCENRSPLRAPPLQTIQGRGATGTLFLQAQSQGASGVECAGIHHRLGVALTAQHHHQVRYHRCAAFIVKLDDVLCRQVLNRI